MKEKEKKKETEESTKRQQSRSRTHAPIDCGDEDVKAMPIRNQRLTIVNHFPPTPRAMLWCPIGWNRQKDRKMKARGSRADKERKKEKTFLG